MSACSDDPDDTNNVVVSNGQNNTKDTGGMSDGMTTTPDMGSDDMSDGGQVDTGGMEDMEPDVPTVCVKENCPAGNDCVNNACKIVDSCAGAKDLGELKPGTPINEIGSFIDSGSDDISGSCGNGLERVFSFTLSAGAVVDFEAKWTGQFDGVVSLRTDCEDDASEVACDDVESGFRVLQPGTYFLVLEVKFGNPNQFELDLAATELNCEPGVGICENNDLSYCTVNQPVTYACADTCTNGACDGDQCDAPVVIPGQGGAFSGAAFDYENSYNFQNNPNVNCQLNTNGYDVVYSLGTLDPGNIVNVKSSPFDSVFIMKGAGSCGEMGECVRLFDGNSDVDYVIPPMQGDEYFVIIDTDLGIQPNMFNHEINIPNR